MLHLERWGGFTVDPPDLQVDVSSNSHRKVKGIAVTDGGRSFMEGSLKIGTSDTLPHMLKVHGMQMISNMRIHDMAIFATFRFQHIRRIAELKSMSEFLLKLFRQAASHLIHKTWRSSRLSLPGAAETPPSWLSVRGLGWLASRMPWKSRKRRKLSLRLGFPASSTLLQWDVYFKGKRVVHCYGTLKKKKQFLDGLEIDEEVLFF